MYFLQIINTLKDILFPIECVNCKKEKVWICSDCLKKININTFHVCPKCKKETRKGEFCPGCQNNFILDRVLVAGNFQDPSLSKLVKIYKYNFAKEISQILGEFLFLFLEKNNFHFKNAYLVPVPLHAKRLRFRGFNQSEELAKVISEKTNISLNTNLQRTKYSTPQSNLNRTQRLNNLQNCFSYQGENLQQKNIILVDDVATTNTTLNECAKVLKKHGANRVYGLVVASND